MYGSYRSIFAAIAGLVLVGASPPNHPEIGKQPKGEPSEAFPPAFDYSAYPDKYAEACYSAQDHDAADLCAQWRAAIAAEKSSDSAWWGNIVGAVSATISLISIILVVIALRQTNKSLRLAQRDRADATRRAIAQSDETAAAHRLAKSANKIAKEAAQESVAAMHEQNVIARSVQRPWIAISVKPVLYSGGIREHHFRFEITSKNVGQRPATHFGSRAKLFFFGEAIKWADAADEIQGQLDKWFATNRHPSKSILAPNDAEISPYWTTPDFDEVPTKRIYEFEVTYPLLLVASFYRTEITPNVSHLVWRVWRVNTKERDGDDVSFFRLDRDFTADFLNLTTYLTTRHEERQARDYDDQQDR